MSRAKNSAVLTAYGTKEDDEKLQLLADRFHKSKSEMITTLVREKFEQVFKVNTVQTEP